MATFTKINSYTCASAQTSIYFNSIPSTYKHLYLYQSQRNDKSGTNSQTQYQLNSDTASNYWDIQFLGYGASTLDSGWQGPKNNLQNPQGQSAGFTGSVFGMFRLFIPAYSNALYNKTALSVNAVEGGSTAYTSVFASYWSGTGAIDTIRIFEGSGAGYITGSTFDLYGLSN